MILIIKNKNVRQIKEIVHFDIPKLSGVSQVFSFNVMNMKLGSLRSVALSFGIINF